MGCKARSEILYVDLKWVDKYLIGFIVCCLPSREC